MPSNFDCVIQWRDGVEEFCRFDYIPDASGKKRDTFACEEIDYKRKTPLALKAQLVEGDAMDYNRKEWMNYLSIGALRVLTPRAHGWAVAKIPGGDVRMSVLVVDRVGFTFREMMQKLAVGPVTRDNICLITKNIREVIGLGICFLP